MGGIGNPVHLAFIAIIALIFLGPKRLPDLAKSLGSGMREFRESLSSEHRDEPAHLPPVDAPAPVPAPAPGPTAAAPRATAPTAPDAG